ncbi:MAG TPA: TonB-dependent receptor [Kofleriaceae bacterium]|nr:TonB-dependent receptor [Kofleriaceae bacterium]
MRSTRLSWMAAILLAAAPAAAQTPTPPPTPTPAPAPSPTPAPTDGPDTAAPAPAPSPSPTPTPSPAPAPDATADATAPGAATTTDGTETKTDDDSIDLGLTGETVFLSDSVVSVTRDAHDPFDVPVATDVVDRQQIEQHRATMATDLVRDLPGVWANGSGFVNTTPNLRGTIGNQTLLMIDGVRINTAQAFSGPNSFFQTMDLEDIDHIEIVRGPGSVAWGTDALGGTLHVFTKAPPEWATDGGTNRTARFAASFGSVDMTQRYRAEVGVAGERVRGQVGVTTMDRGDLKSAGANGILSPSSYRERAIDARIDVKPRPDQVLTFSLQDHENDDIEQYEISLQRPQVTDSLRRLGLVKWVAADPAHGVRRLEAWAALQQQGSTGTQINNGTEQVTGTLTASLDVQATSNVTSKADITYGVHAHRDTAESVNTNGAAARTRSFPDSAWLDMAAFATGELRPHPRLSILAGARVDLYKLDTDPDMQSVPNGLTLADLDVHSTSVAPTGSLGVVAHATPWLNVVGSVSRGFRAPNISDQVSSGPNRQSYAYPSTGLSPETDLDFEGGVKVRREKVSGSITGYYLKINDLIQSVRRKPDDDTDCVDIDMDGMCDPNEFITVKENVGKAHIAGAELEAAAEVAPHLTVSAVGTWNTGHDDTGDQALTFNIPMNGTLTVRYAPERYYVEGWLRGVAPVGADEIQCSRVQSDAGYHTDPRDVNSPLIGTLQVMTVDGKAVCTGEFPGYALAGLRGGARLTSNVNLDVSLNNLTNTAYRDKDARFDGPAFGVFGTLTVHEK